MLWSDVKHLLALNPWERAKVESDSLVRLREMTEVVLGPEFRASIVDGILEAVPDALLVTDPRGIIVLANHSCELLFGHPRSQLIGYRVEKLVPADLTDVQHRGMDGDLHGKTAAGDLLPVELWVHPLATVDGMYTVTVIRRLAPSA